MSAHTPGPWLALDWERVNGGTDWNVWGPTPSNHIGTDLAGEYGSEADARLIAAAPELLEALNALLKAVEGTAGCHLAADILEGTVVGNARAAIAKAKGEA